MDLQSTFRVLQVGAELALWVEVCRICSAEPADHPVRTNHRQYTKPFAGFILFVHSILLKVPEGKSVSPSEQTRRTEQAMSSFHRCDTPLRMHCTERNPVSVRHFLYLCNDGCSGSE